MHQDLRENLVSMELFKERLVLMHFCWTSGILGILFWEAVVYGLKVCGLSVSRASTGRQPWQRVVKGGCRGQCRASLYRKG